MRGAMWVIGGFVWAVVVFIGTFFLTFPSQVVADRVRYEIPNLLGDDYSGEVGSVRPWWVGLSADDIKIYKEPGRSEAEDDIPQLVALLGNVRLRVSPWSLLRRAPYVSGSVKLTEGRVDYAVGTAVGERGDIQLADLVLGADAMPLADLFLLIPNTKGSGEGAVDLEVDLHAGEGGMRDATGRVSISGADLLLDKSFELPGIGAIGLDIPISELSLAADVAEGVATISSGKLDSLLVTVQLTGTVTLRDPIDRSAVDVQIVLSNLGEAIAPFASLMSEAKQPDGTYHYSCRGVLSRLSENSCSAGERRVSTRTPGAVGSSTPIPRPSSTSTPRDPESDEERERRRDEIRERLRQKREERDAERTGAVAPPPAEDPIEDEDPEQTDEEDEEEPPVDLEGDQELEEPLE